MLALGAAHGRRLGFEDAEQCCIIPYPGKLGVIEVGALADLLLVEGDPTADIRLMADPAKNFVVIMKDGKLIKNIVS